MRHFATVALAGLLALTGCSFRMPAPLAGEITSLHVEATGVNSPTRIRAQVIFTGAVDAATLAVVKGSEGDAIQLTAFAQAAQPFLGLGVLPVDRTSKRTLELETTLALSKAGAYKVEGLSGSEQRVTATTTLQVQ